MEIVILVDVETTGLNPETDKIIELGAVAYDPEKKKILGTFSQLCKPGKENPVSNEITQITGITQKEVETFGVSEGTLLYNFEQWFGIWAVDEVNQIFFAAHNAPFDKGFLLALKEASLFGFNDYRWIDTKEDLPFPNSVTSRKLIHLVPEICGFVNPFSHRALFDAISTAKLLGAFDWELVKRRINQEKWRVTALVTYHERETAKEAGFRWNGNAWQKDLYESELQEQGKTWTFLFDTKLIRKDGVELE